MNEEYEKWIFTFGGDDSAEWSSGDMEQAYEAGQKCPTKDVQDVIDAAQGMVLGDYQISSNAGDMVRLITSVGRYRR